MPAATLPFFASAPFGCQGLLADELRRLGISERRLQPLGVSFLGTMGQALHACFASRIASRILLVLGRFGCCDGDSLYEAACRIDWCAHLRPDKTFAVRCTRGPRVPERLHHTHHAALRVKDAIVDRMRAVRGVRPDVDTATPDLRIDVYLRDGHAHIAVDLATPGLHRRGYRTAGAPAPLKENLAAALLMHSGWPRAAAAGQSLCDPMCGGGTLLIEAATMALGIPPNWQRQRFGFLAWAGLDMAVYQEVRAQVQAQARDGLERLAAGAAPRLTGMDHDAAALALADVQLRRAGVMPMVALALADVRCAKPPSPHGHIVCNPPYGRRLSAPSEVSALYGAFGVALHRFCGWRAHILVPATLPAPAVAGESGGNGAPGPADAERANADGSAAAAALGLHVTRRQTLYNGQLPCVLLHARVRPHAEAPQGARACALASPQAAPTVATAPAASAIREMHACPDAGDVTMLKNRLTKNLARLRAWRSQHAVECFRVYDADLPEYAAAIDVYGPRLHVQEYAPPVAIEAGKRQRRLATLVAAAIAVLPDVLPQHIVVKERRRTHPRTQYAAAHASATPGRRGPAAVAPSEAFASGGAAFQVSEGRAKFWVNLDGYLDTGLFLDHRRLRRWLQQHSSDMQLLNLFGYTGSASVAAAVGGAHRTVTVDLSATYLDWAARNFALNGLVAGNHTLVRADCIAWLETHAGTYDFIFVDPPTFSNSKRLARPFDVQRDHVALLCAARRRLRPGGRLVFSTHLSRFCLDAASMAAHDPSLRPREITGWSLDEDFKGRRRHVHRAWLVAGPDFNPATTRRAHRLPPRR